MGSNFQWEEEIVIKFQNFSVFCLNVLKRDFALTTDNENLCSENK